MAFIAFFLVFCLSLFWGKMIMSMFCMIIIFNVCWCLKVFSVSM